MTHAARTRLVAFVLALLAVVLVGAGCERVSDRDGTDATLLLTEGYGQTPIADDTIAAGRSVMDGVRATQDVETSYGGGFVAKMADRAMTTSPARDWFYFVNGLAPGRSATEPIVRAGDVIWWDYRAWSGHPTASAVVGAWPEPFINGYPTAPTSVQADSPLDAILRDRGATVTAAASPWRVRVGSDADLTARDPAWSRARAASDSELLARIHEGRVQVIDPDGAWTDVPSGRAIAVAVLTRATPEDGGMLLAVVGLTAKDAEAAAQTIATEPEVLRGKYAVAFDATGTVTATAGWTAP